MNKETILILTLNVLTLAEPTFWKGIYKEDKELTREECDVTCFYFITALKLFGR